MGVPPPRSLRRYAHLHLQSSLGAERLASDGRSGSAPRGWKGRAERRAWRVSPEPVATPPQSRDKRMQFINLASDSAPRGLEGRAERRAWPPPPPPQAGGSTPSRDLALSGASASLSRSMRLASRPVPREGLRRASPRHCASFRRLHNPLRNRLRRCTNASSVSLRPPVPPPNDCPCLHKMVAFGSIHQLRGQAHVGQDKSENSKSLPSLARLCAQRGMLAHHDSTSEVAWVNTHTWLEA